MICLRTGNYAITNSGNKVGPLYRGTLGWQDNNAHYFWEINGCLVGTVIEHQMSLCFAGTELECDNYRKYKEIHE